MKHENTETWTPDPYPVEVQDHWAVCRHVKRGGGGTEWLSVTRRWLPALRLNVRHYEHFPTEQDAQEAIGLLIRDSLPTERAGCAPDLLDFAKRVATWDFDLDGDCVAEAQEAARNEIAKAEGKI